jgi:hypothetical protein
MYNIRTLQEAKDYLNENYMEGCHCPACGQNVKLYKRKLNSGMARVLVAMHKNTNSFFHIKDYLRKNNIRNTHDWTLLKHWKMIEKCKENDGHWRITHTGTMFVECKMIANKHIFILNNQFKKYSNEGTNIIEALGDHFDYKELMDS